jgi:hypothetical protein
MHSGFCKRSVDRGLKYEKRRLQERFMFGSVWEVQTHQASAIWYKMGTQEAITDTMEKEI